jgi:S-adenosylmethionine decarboxylase
MNPKNYLAFGWHVLVDISDAEPGALNDIEQLEHALLSAAINEGVTVLGVQRHAFDPSGVTILLLLSESHISLHTYPQQGKAFFDAFTCGVNLKPENIFHAFARHALPGQYNISQVQRGWIGEDE